MRNPISKLTVVLIILCVAIFIGCRDREEEEVVVATPTPTVKPQTKTTPAPKGAPSPAAESSASRGQISEIKGDAVTVKDQMGNTNTFKLSDPETVIALKVGDSVAISIHKLDSGLINETTGTVTVVTGDNLTVEDDAGSRYTFKVTDPKIMENFTPGSKITIRVEKTEAATDAETDAGTMGTEGTPMPNTTPAPNATTAPTTAPAPTTTTTPTPTVTPNPQ